MNDLTTVNFIESYRDYMPRRFLARVGKQKY